MGEEIAFENGWISEFQGLVTLTLDRVILHTVMHHSSTCTYTPNFIEIEETFCGRTNERTDRHLRPTSLSGPGEVDLKREVKAKIPNGALKDSWKLELSNHLRMTRCMLAGRCSRPSRTVGSRVIGWSSDVFRCVNTTSLATMKFTTSRPLKRSTWLGRLTFVSSPSSCCNSLNLVHHTAQPATFHALNSALF